SPRWQVLVVGAAVAAVPLVSRPAPVAFAAADGKFMPVIDRMADYSFVYPFGWQEVFVQGQDKVYKDVIEPLESVSINMIATTKEDIRDLGPPDQVPEALVRKVLSQPTQKTKLIEAKEVHIDGRAYYTFEFTAQDPNFTRHVLGTITIANGKFYTPATGANERRWDKMKDRLHTIVDSFKIETKVKKARPSPRVALSRATRGRPTSPSASSPYRSILAAAGDRRRVPRAAADEGGGEALGRDAARARA
ncbi:psbP-like protein 1, chloroplastic, partial [Triticum aestivum]|uniref:psbP-like protein 1, chloroplastic n=1 Tax=Triticum aestivum TaxID=4565 RepID=UPI001D0354F1